MCLGVPGKLIQWLDRDPLLARGLVEFDGVRREVHLACVPDAVVDEYLIVHAGIAICRMDAAAAEQLWDELRRHGGLDLADEAAP